LEEKEEAGGRRQEAGGRRQEEEEEDNGGVSPSGGVHNKKGKKTESGSKVKGSPATGVRLVHIEVKPANGLEDILGTTCRAELTQTPELGLKISHF